MFYVVLTVAMLLGNAQPGRIVVTEMDMSAGSLPPINQADAPLGSRLSYMDRKKVEQALILFHCGAPAHNNGLSTAYECQGMY